MRLTRTGRFITIAVVLLGGTAAAYAQLTVVPSMLSFTSQGGQTAQPLDSTIQVSSSIPTNTTIAVNQPWVALYDQSGNPIQGNESIAVPSVLYVRVAGSTIPTTPGTYSATVTFTVSGTVGTSATVAISLVVQAPGTGSLVVSPSSLTFNYQVGAPLPLAQRLSITSTGGSLSFNLNWSTANGTPWLSVVTNSYVTPATATVAAVPVAGMGPGVYTGVVYVIPATGNTQTIPITLIIGSVGTLTASPSSLTFNYQSGSNIPSAQPVAVVNVVGGNVAYTVAATTTNGVNWLAASVTSATTPSSFLVSVFPISLSPGTYYGSVNIYQSGSTVPASQVPVTLVVSSTNQLLVNPSTLTFSLTSGNAAPPSQFLSVTSTGAPIQFTASVSGPSWVTLSPPSSGTTPTGLSVNVTPPAGVAPGTYSAMVVVSASAGGSSASASVTINVSPSNFLTVTQTSMLFNYTLGGTSPAAQYASVTSSSGSIPFQAVPAAAGFGPWLKAIQSSPNTPATVTVTVNPQGLAAGTYNGTVSIVADATNNSPQTITVTLNVTKAATFTSNPFGMSFSYQLGQADPPAQVAVISSEGTALPFSVSSSTSSGGAWLLAGGSGPTPSAVVAGISPNSLAPGFYSGSINIQPSDTTLLPLQMPVILNVAAGPVFLPSTNQLSFQYQLNGPVPQAQNVTIAASSASIVYYPTAETGDGGTWLQVSPSVGVTPSAVSVTVNLAGLTAGTYYGVVTVNDTAGVAPAAYVPVSLQVSSGPILSVAGQLLTFTATAGGTPPPVQQIKVGGSGVTLPFHVDTSGGSWLQVTPTDGSTDAVLSVAASPANMTPGYYLGLITTSIPGVTGSQQYVPVAFVVQ